MKFFAILLLAAFVAIAVADNSETTAAHAEGEHGKEEHGGDHAHADASPPPADGASPAADAGATTAKQGEVGNKVETTKAGAPANGKAAQAASAGAKAGAACNKKH
jgi:hypothetical protein